MLEGVISTVTAALCAAGLSAGAAYPKAAVGRENDGFIRVGVAKASDRSAGFDRYLGVRDDAERGEKEIYGLRCDIELGLDVYAPPDAENAATACAALFDAAAAVICSVPGLQVRELNCGAPGPDRETGMFRLSGGVKCAGLLTVEDSGGSAGASFTDFILRGELQA